FTYSIPGTYQPVLIALDGLGCSDTFTLPVNINIYEVPSADFLPDKLYLRLPDNVVNFNNLSVASTVLNNNWDFGDPGSGTNTSTVQNPSHTYSDSGSFRIRLIVDNGHCYDTAYRNIRIDYYLPVTNFAQ